MDVGLEIPEPPIVTDNPFSHDPDKLMDALVCLLEAGELMLTAGARVSRVKLRELFPIFPAESFCETGEENFRSFRFSFFLLQPQLVTFLSMGKR